MVSWMIPLFWNQFRCHLQRKRLHPVHSQTTPSAIVEAAKVRFSLCYTTFFLNHILFVDGFNISSGTTNSNNIGLTSAHLQPYDPHNPSAPSTSSTLIPTGTRISDWCYTGPLESSPPIVKSRELYENVRLLGRGAFGEVHLTKNMEDHKL